MKKVLALILMVAGMSYSQTWTNLGSTAGGRSELWAIQAWAPWAAAADTGTDFTSDPLNVSGVDSIHVWSSAISSAGTAHCVAAFRGGFSSTYASTTSDSLFAIIDTTNAKLETLNFFATAFPKGAQWAVARVSQSTGGKLLGNFYTGRRDQILNFYLRLYFTPLGTPR